MVPSLFGTRDQFHGRQFSHEAGGRVGAPRAPVRSVEAASARDSKTSVMCHSPLLADCSWIKD